MKYLGLITFATIMVTIAACQGPAEDTIHTKNYEVERLFEIDGCNVYRFYDGATKHFVTCPGNARVSWKTTQVVGKVVTTHKHEVDTAWPITK
jgi:hypothetical protein